MCQQWLSIIGLAADVIGFVAIAIEWHRTFSHSVEVRQQELHDAYERNEARYRGESVPPGWAEEEETMVKEFSKLAGLEALFRKRLFFIGVVLVLAGFILQAMGSWPYADPIFGFKSC